MLDLSNCNSTWSSYSLSSDVFSYRLDKSSHIVLTAEFISSKLAVSYFLDLAFEFLLGILEFYPLSLD
jgi:hypothetical protein